MQAAACMESHPQITYNEKMGKALIPSAKVYGCSAVQNAIRKIRSAIMEKSAAILRIFPLASQFYYCKHFTSGTFFTTKRFY